MLKEAGKDFINIENQKSLNKAKSALHFSIELNDNELIAKSYNIIGLNFDEYLDANKALEYYEKGLVHANLTKNDSLKQWLYNNIGNLYYFSLNENAKSILYYKKALDYAIKIKDIAEVNYIKQNIVNAYFAEKKYNIAKVYLDEIADYVNNEGQVEAKITFNTSLGEYYNYQKNSKLTEKYYLKAYEISKKNREALVETQIASLFLKLSDFYAKEKKYDKAYFFLYKSEELNNKIYNDDKVSLLLNSKNALELDEYKREIDRVEQENKAYIKSLSINKTINILLISLYVIIAILFILLFKNHKIRSKLNTTLEIQNSELEIAKVKAEENANIKSQFVSTVTHEIRTPLYGIIGLIDLLIEEHKEFSDNQKIKSLSFSANYLLMLINDVLQTNKLESRKFALELNKFSIEQVILKIIDSLQYLAKQNNNQILFTNQKNFPEFIYGDKTKFVQIIMNLLTNALKFTTNGTVEIDIKSISKTEEVVQFEINIKDTGIGIDENEQKIIFNKFIQLNRKQTDYQGTGLGLFIVKSLVEILNGKISLKSKENVGTEINLTLSFSLKPGDNLNNVRKNIKKLKKSTRVLIVDDNEINQLVSKKIIEKNNLIATVVGGGFEAIKTLESNTFDIILMDINMPEIDGFETARRIKKTNPNLPIIALTATDANEIKSKIAQQEIDEVIVKPFIEEELLTIIYDILKDKK